jgi:hypothetical protein
MQALDVQWDKGALMLEKTLGKKVQVECPVVHRFGPGIYIREVSFLAGTLAVGHHHNQAHVNMFLKGRARFLNADGTYEDLQAPHFFVGPPGRKVAYFYTDSVWQNIFATDETDIEKLEEMFLTKSPVHKEMIAGIEELDRLVDREDFLNACEEFGMSPWMVRKVAMREDDRCPMPDSFTVQVGESPIEGKGLFATSPFNSGDLIAPARIAGKRTIAGRYTNHAKEPNSTAVRFDNGDISFVAIQDISGNRGGSLGDEITVDYRQVLAINEELSCQV